MDGFPKNRVTKESLPSFLIEETESMRLLIRQECYANQTSEWAGSQCPSLRLLIFFCLSIRKQQV